METLRKNSTVRNSAILTVVALVLLAMIGFGIRSEGRLSALETKTGTMQTDIDKIDDIQKNINDMNKTLTKVKTDIDWIKGNSATQTKKIDEVLKKLQ